MTMTTAGQQAHRPARTKRRRYTATYKLQILERYDNAPNGRKGEILRAEGLYTTQPCKWRRLRDAGKLTPGSASRKTTAMTPAEKELAAVRKKLRETEAKLEQAEKANTGLGKCVTPL